MTTEPASHGRRSAPRSRTDVRPWSRQIVAAARTELEALIAHTPSDQCERRGELTRWSPKDELAHLAFWIALFSANIRARRTGGQVTDTRPYQALNDAAWRERYAWTWAEVAQAIAHALDDVAVDIAALSVAELTDPTWFSVEPEDARARPLLRSLLYELVDHPIHHITGLYARYRATDALVALDVRLTDVLQQPGTGPGCAPPCGGWIAEGSKRASPTRERRCALGWNAPSVT